MGLLDFDDEEIMKGFVPAIAQKKSRKKDFDPDENFGDLQKIGHEPNSEDFSDSPFADRKPI